MTPMKWSDVNEDDPYEMVWCNEDDPYEMVWCK